MNTFFCVYFGAAFLAQTATPIVTYIAKKLNIVDNPDPRKIHVSPIPRIGGVSIVFSVMVVMICVLALDNVIGDELRVVQIRVLVLLSGGAFMFLVGLLDDIRSVPARIKLLCLIVSSAALCATGARIESISVDSLFTLNLGWVSWPITVIWIAGITVAINFIDGLDGLAVGIAGIVCGVIAIFAFYSGQVVMGVLMLGLLGALTGFLFFNFNPAKIFMGDCGSMFLGFVIGGASVICQTKTSTLVGIALPALALGVPLYDTAFTLIRRKILDRRSIFSGERGHIHHRLLDKGLNQRCVVFIMYAVTLAVAGIGLLMLITRSTGTFAVIAATMVLLLLLFRIAGASRIKETLSAIHRNSAITREVKRERGDFEEVQLQMRRTRCFEEWWASACDMAQRMEFDEIFLMHKPGPSGANTYLWRRTDAELLCPDETINVKLPLGGNHNANTSHIKLAIRINGSLEAVGRRVTLFARLLDEHNPHDAHNDIRDHLDDKATASGEASGDLGAI